MGNKIATEEDYWMCSGGIMPARMQSVQPMVKQSDTNKYLLNSDTATLSTGDFVCKWVMLIAAAIAAILAVAIVATGGAALGAIVAAGAAWGAGGAAVGSLVGALVCGQKAAIARTWIGEKVHLMIAGQKTLTSGSVMECPIFSSKIVHAPNVKNFWDALRVGIGNFAETVVMGALGGALIGVGGAVISGAAALAVPTFGLFGSVASNLVGSVTGVGMAVRVLFGANAVSNQQALGQINIENQEQRDVAFGNAAFPEYGSVKRIASGNAEPMDAMLLLYFLNLRIPGAKPGAMPKEEANGGNKEENVGAKDNENKQPIENKAADPETAGSGKQGKAYEREKSITSRLNEIAAEAKAEATLSIKQEASIQRSLDRAATSTDPKIRAYHEMIAAKKLQMYKGTQIDTRFKELVQEDLFLQENGIKTTPRGKKGPDVYNSKNKEYWDLTTEKDWNKGTHQKKYDTDFGKGTGIFW